MPKKKVDPLRDDVREMQKQRALVGLDKRRANAGEQTDRVEQQRAKRRAEEWDWEGQLRKAHGWPR